MNPYEVLGIKKDADTAQIKDAYWRFASKHHPGKGGEEEVFKQGNDAYKTLSCAKRKKLYDTMGISDDSLKRDVYCILQKFFLSLLTEFGPERILNVDVVKAIDNRLQMILVKIKDMNKTLKLDIKRHRAILKRIKHKNPNNALTVIVQGQINALSKQVEADNQEAYVTARSRTTLKTYGFEYDAAPTFTNTVSSQSPGTWNLKLT